MDKVYSLPVSGFQRKQVQLGSKGKAPGYSLTRGNGLKPKGVLGWREGAHTFNTLNPDVQTEQSPGGLTKTGLPRRAHSPYLHPATRAQKSRWNLIYPQY